MPPEAPGRSGGGAARGSSSTEAWQRPLAQHIPWRLSLLVPLLLAGRWTGAAAATYVRDVQIGTVAHSAGSTVYITVLKLNYGKSLGEMGSWLGVDILACQNYLPDFAASVVKDINQQGSTVINGTYKTFAVQELSVTLDEISKYQSWLQDPKGIVLGPCASQAAVVQSILLLGGNATTMLVPNSRVKSVFAGRPQIFAISIRADAAFTEALRTVTVEPGKVASFITVSTTSTAKEVCGGFPEAAARAGLTSVSIPYVYAQQEQEAANLARGMPEPYNMSDRFALFGHINDLKKAGVEYLAVCFTAPLCGEFVREARKAGYFPTMMFLPRVCLSHLKPGDRRWLAFSEDFQIYNKSSRDLQGSRFDIENPEQMQMSSMLSVGTRALIKAVQNVGSNKAIDAARGLLAMDLQTDLGRVVFDSDGRNMGKRQVYQWFEAAQDSLPSLISEPTVSKLSFLPKPDVAPCFTPGNFNEMSMGFDGIGACVDCPLAGLGMSVYLTAEVSRHCRTCPAGKNGRTSPNLAEYGNVCTSCTLGQAVAGSGCKDCSPGYESSRYVVCQPCGLGYFAGSLGAAACSECPRGRASTTVGGTQCKQCERGFSAPAEGMLYCLQCMVGLFAKEPGLSACPLCPAGTVANKSKMSGCYRCEPGKYSSFDASACIPCPSGTAQARFGQVTCTSGKGGFDLTDPTEGLVYLNNLDNYFYNSILQTAEFCKLSEGCRRNHGCAAGHIGVFCMTCSPSAEGQPGFFRTKKGICTECRPKVLNIITVSSVVVLCSVCMLVILRMVLHATTTAGCVHAVVMKQVVWFLFLMSHIWSGLQQMVMENKAFLPESLATWSMFDSLFRIAAFVSSVHMDTPWWSVTCLVQPQMDAQHLRTLEAATHDMLGDPALDQARAALQHTQKTTEMRFVIATVCLPVAIVIIAYFMGFLLLQKDLAWHADLYKNAFRFFQHVYMKGFWSQKVTSTAVEWQGFVCAYEKHLFQLWRPLCHSGVFAGRMIIRYCNLQLFFQEGTPIFQMVYFLSFQPVCEGLFRFRGCFAGLSNHEQQYHLSAAEVKCGSYWVLYVSSLVLGLLWWLAPSFFMYVKLSTQKNNIKKPSVLHFWGLLVDGYRTECWWWEVLRFGQKGLIVFLMSLNVSNTTKMDFLLVCILGFTMLHAYFKPFEDRRDHLFDRVEIYIYAVTLSAVLLLKITTVLQDAMAFTAIASLILVSFVLLYAGLVAIVARSYVRMAIKVGSLTAPPHGAKGIWHCYRHYLFKWEDDDRHSPPYLTFDQDYGWLNIFGTGGDKAINLYIARRADARDLEGKRPLLSACALETPQPGVIETASDMTRIRFHETVTATMEHVLASVGSRANLSVGLLEFVIRACFLMNRNNLPETKRETVLAEAQVPDRDVIAKAYSKKGGADPVMLQLGAGANEDPNDAFIVRALNVEEDIRKNTCKHFHHQEAGELRQAVPQSLIRFVRLCGLRKQQTKEKTHTRDAGDGLASGVEASPSESSASQDDAAATAEEKAIPPKQLMKLLEKQRLLQNVNTMFSPGLFSQGLSIDDFQMACQSLVYVQHETLTEWLHAYELRWRVHRIDRDRGLFMQVGGIVDTTCNTNEEDLQEMAGPLKLVGAVCSWMLLVMKMSCAVLSANERACERIAPEKTIFIEEDELRPGIGKEDELRPGIGKASAKAKPKRQIPRSVIATSKAETLEAKQKQEELQSGSFQTFRGLAEIVSAKSILQLAHARAEHSKTVLQAKLELTRESLANEQVRLRGVERQMAQLHATHANHASCAELHDASAQPAGGVVHREGIFPPVTAPTPGSNRAEDRQEGSEAPIESDDRNVPPLQGLLSAPPPAETRPRGLLSELRAASPPLGAARPRAAPRLLTRPLSASADRGAAEAATSSAGAAMGPPAEAVLPSGFGGGGHGVSVVGLSGSADSQMTEGRRPTNEEQCPVDAPGLGVSVVHC